MIRKRIKMLFVVLFLSLMNNSFGQAKNASQKTSTPSVKNEGTIIISSNKPCIISINGMQVDLLNENEIKTIKYPAGMALLKAVMTFSDSIFILKEISIDKVNASVLVLDFEKEIAYKEGERKQKETEASIRSAIANYRSTFYQADCKSPLLESQVNYLQKLKDSLVKKCIACNGKRELTVEKECSYCSGLGITECLYCKHGEAPCKNCKATGKVYCSCVYETLSDILLKRFHYNPYCNICGGSSGGKGLVNCSSCSGSGKVTCSYCRGSGEKKCGYCKNGFITRKDCCDDCKGIGRIIE